MLQIAINYLRAGLSVLPINPSTKRPKLSTWTRLQTERLSEEDAERAFYDNPWIGVIGGAISGNLEIIDFDNHGTMMQEWFAEFMTFIDTFGLPYERTPRGGYHVFYRCEEPIEGNKKLASVFDPVECKPMTIIETRGEGGYVVTAPSKGYLMIEGDLTAIPVISKEARDQLISFCCAFNEIEEKEYIEPDSNGYFNYGAGDRVGDRYNESPQALAECRAILTHAGWRFSNDGRYAKRPGKTDNGYSATLGIAHSRAGIPLFYVFSSNATPFEPMHSYNPYAVFTLLAYGGDFTKATKEMAQRIEFADLSRPNAVRKTRAELPAFVQEEIVKETMVAVEPTPMPSVTYDDGKDITKAESYIMKHYNLRRDVIKHTVEYQLKGTTDWEKVSTDNIFRALQHLGIKFKHENIKSLLASSFVRDYNPIEEYFTNLKPWDGIDHFSLFASYITVDDRAFFAKMLEKHFVRAIKCALEPTFYNRFVFVFQSHNQEIGKSRIINFFNPLDDRFFSSESLNQGKDTTIALTEIFIYALEELDDTNKIAGGLSKLKDLIARRTVNERLPYAAQKTLMHRICTFFGTANSAEFLIDDLNTRWLVFKTDAIDPKLFTHMDVNNMWAQAYQFYKDESYEWDLTREEKIRREERNLAYRQSNMEQELIALNFRVPEDPKKVMPMTAIVKRLMYVAPAGVRIKSDLTYIHDILVGMGFQEDKQIIMNTYVKTFHIETNTGE